ncbi:MAG: hypothetical protein COA96_13845 [SAR86 cluster bacterium]|uniref:Esterase n=1 Tax=SAR86 cluster bacterium TaxID=2030880 RepID=A0A2A5AU04_9GAMM|nr:MAG: hypothetical protein COA96_13845 [SAR86 cluster bacterium]
MKKKESVTALTISAWIIYLVIPAVAIAAEIGIGEKVYIDSEVLGETRELWISIPENQLNSEERYPVLYLLDGDSNFRHVSAVAEFLAASNRIPHLIVVGVLNTDRGRDLTPPSTDPDDTLNFPTHGGANNLQEFFKSELFPFIEKNYRVRPYKILVGHSLGGLFAIHTLTTRPELFNAYIAISPSLHWSKQGMVNQAEKFLASTNELQVDFYMTTANEGGSSLAAFRKLAGALGEHNPRGFRWDYNHMPEETHASVALKSLYFGLESIFNGWSLDKAVEVYKIAGIEALEAAYQSGGQRYGYERALSNPLLLQIASQLIDLNQLDQAAQLITEDFDAVPPSYFLNLLADKYMEYGNSVRAKVLYESSLINNPSDALAKARLVEMGIDPSTLITEVLVEEEVLQSYVGDYQLQPNFVLTIFIDSSKLYSQGPGQRAAELVPLSSSRFSMTGDDSQIEFFSAVGIEASRLVLRKFGMEMEAVRLRQ